MENDNRDAGRISPNSIEAEEAVLGCMLINKSSVSKAIDNLHASSFYNPANSIIFENIVELFTENLNIDYVGLIDKLKKKKKLKMIKFNLSNRIAIVTGGAQGFGLAIAKKFLDCGAEVIVWDIDKSALKRTQESIKNEKFTTQIVDITNFNEVTKNIELITNKKNIDIFINNAGIAGLNSKVWDYPIDEWKKVINVNLNSIFYCCKAVVPHMIKNNYGRIVNIASIAGKEGNPNASAYSASKAGVIGLTKSLGKELADKNIAVNVVTPAGAKTRIFDQMTKEHINYMLSKVPRNRFLEVDELASLVAWLASEENSFSTGAVFDISGGRATY